MPAAANGSTVVATRSTTTATLPCPNRPVRVVGVYIRVVEPTTLDPAVLALATGHRCRVDCWSGRLLGRKGPGEGSDRRRGRTHDMRVVDRADSMNHITPAPVTTYDTCQQGISRFPKKPGLRRRPYVASYYGRDHFSTCPHRSSSSAHSSTSTANTTR